MKTIGLISRWLLALLCLTSSGSAGTPRETLRLQSLPFQDPPSLILHWSGEPDRTYRLETSADLAVWTPINQTPLRGNGGITEQILPLEGSRRFFRLVRLKDSSANGFVRIASGSFVMGDAFAEGMPSERPRHTVELSDFLIAKHPVTWQQWQEVYNWGITHGYEFRGTGAGKGDNHPVHTITWHDAIKWCNARSEKEGLNPIYFIDKEKTAVYRTGVFDIDNARVRWEGNGYRLPTEAEWEKAARGGLEDMRFPSGNEIAHEEANYWAEFPGSPYDRSFPAGFHPEYADGPMPYTSPVEAFPPNSFGLYDMAGNVWEWVWDWFEDDYYMNSPPKDPHGPSKGNRRVARGGSWVMSAIACRVSDRFSAPPGDRSHSWGFRIVKNPEKGNSASHSN